MSNEVDDSIKFEYDKSIIENIVDSGAKEEVNKSIITAIEEAKFDIDKALDSYDPTFPRYKPSANAIDFFNIMRLVQGGDFEFNTPIAHYFMVDLLLNEITDTSVFPFSEEVCKTINLNTLRLAFMESRGMSKSTVIISFFGVYSAIKGVLPNGIGKVWFYLVIAASSRGGARVNALAVKAMCEDSVFIKDYFESVRYTESETEFVRKGNGPKKNRSFLIRYQGVGTGIRGSRYGERRICCHVKGTIVTTEYGTYPVEKHPGVMAEPMLDTVYEVALRGITDTEVVNKEHKYWAKLCVGNKCVLKEDYNEGRYKGKVSRYTELPAKFVTVADLTDRHWIGSRIDTTVNKIQPIEHMVRVDGPSMQERYARQMVMADYMLDEDFWWVYGLWLGDGSLNTKSTAKRANNKGIVVWYIANTQESTIGTKLLKILTKLGMNPKVSKRNEANGCYLIQVNKTSLADWLRTQKGAKNSEKNMPKWVLTIGLSYQKQILLGYIAADGYIDYKQDQVRINSVNLNVLKQLQTISSRLNLPTYIRNTKQAGTNKFPNGYVCNTQHQWELRLRQNVGKVLGIQGLNESTKIKFKQVHISDGVLWRQVKSIKKMDEQMEIVPIQCNNKKLEKITGDIHTYETLFGINHNCIIFDDVILNEAAAYSKTITENIESAIHSDSVSALKGGGKGRIINCFTPFHYMDVNTQLVTSGAYTPCVVPIAKSFDVNSSKIKANDILSSWEAMHPVISILQMVRDAKRVGKLGSFLQERMLRLTSGADRLIPDSCFQWYDRNVVENHIDRYNVYITTDYTTTSGENSDFSGIATWAVSSNDDWFLLNLTLRKRSMQQQYEDTLNEAAYWTRKGKYVEIGIEIDGNQNAHIYGLEKMMMQRGSWFSFARDINDEKGTRKGILSRGSGVKKHERFRIASQILLQKKMWFPKHLKDDEDMKEFISQIQGATHKNFTRADDGPDLISMIKNIKYVLASEDSSSVEFSNTEPEVDRYFSNDFDDDDDDIMTGSTIF